LLTSTPHWSSRARDLACALLELTVEYLRAYEALKQTRGALDFDDMQIRALQLLRNCATVRRRYQRMFRYTLVDETQDIDRLQAQIIDILSEKGNLMVVGDAQQSIYGFRYADPRVFGEWQQRAQTDGGRLVPLAGEFPFPSRHLGVRGEGVWALVGRAVFGVAADAPCRVPVRRAARTGVGHGAARLRQRSASRRQSNSPLGLHAEPDRA
jgi:hypothetical protein